ncbi:hypothetical protein [Zarconia navalis]|uniref:hypothetical protein n=1 Tax=Zarconia navalis TaxID=2992134 RepID=UPI0021F84659|nr:hypothetical protein [Zarconia navalis]
MKKMMSPLTVSFNATPNSIDNRTRLEVQPFQTSIEAISLSQRSWLSRQIVTFEPSNLHSQELLARYAAGERHFSQVNVTNI